MKRALAILLIALQAGSPLGAATYYVDQSAGSDANNGTSAGTPWKNCPGMYLTGVPRHTGSGALAAGDVVYMDSGDTWLLSGTNGQPGCGFLMVAGVRYYGNVWPSVVTSKPASAGAKFLLASNTPSGLVRINQDHATLSNYFEGFELDMNSVSNVAANAIDVNHGFGTNGINRGRKQFVNVWGHDQYGNGTLSNLYQYMFTVSDQSSDASGWVANVDFINCVAERAARDCFVMYPGNHGMVSNILFRGCVAGGIKNDSSYTEGHGFVMKGWVKDSVIEFCTGTNVNSSPFFINGPEDGGLLAPTNFIIRHFIARTLDNNGSVRTYGSGFISGKIYGGLTFPNEASGGFYMAGTLGVYALEVYSCTFLGFCEIGSPSGSGTLAFRDNIIIESDDPPMSDAGADITSHSHNIYYRAGGGTLVNSGASVYTSANLSSYEGTGISSNPLLLDTADLPTSFSGTYGVNMAPDRTGLYPQPGSPAINAGVDLGSSFNTSINTVTRPSGAGWEIGAYEYFEAAPTTYRIPLRNGGLKLIR